MGRKRVRVIMTVCVRWRLEKGRCGKWMVPWVINRGRGDMINKTVSQMFYWNHEWWIKSGDKRKKKIFKKNTNDCTCLPIAHWYVLRGDWLWWGYGTRPATTPNMVMGSISMCVWAAHTASHCAINNIAWQGSSYYNTEVVQSWMIKCW